MKRRAILVAALGAAVLLTGCDNIFGLDNYDQPNATLTGRVVYNGEPIGVRSNGVTLQLWQPSYPLEQNVPVYVDQDGSFSASIFNGEYEINLPPGTWPWVSSTQRHAVSVRGTTNFDVQVTPYYTIQNAQASLNSSVGPSGTVQATFTVGQVDTSRELEFVALYVNYTSFVDHTNTETGTATLTRAEITDLSGPITLSVTLPENVHVTPSPARRNHVYARIGVKTVGVTERLYSQVFQIEI